MLVVFDLDGTLALTEHRSHFLTESTPKDWRGFYAACDLDEPNVPLIMALRALKDQGHTIEIWSGRSDEVIDKTAVWLDRFIERPVILRMREAGDHRPDTVIKEEWIKQFDKPDLVFEDRDRMVDFFRSKGIVCCQVAPGDF